MRAPWRKYPWLIRLVYWEFWPSWIFYAPVWLQHVWLTLKTGTPFFFLATNPGIKGFILSDSKSSTLQLVPEKYRLLSLLIQPGTPLKLALDRMGVKGIGFPVILKPDVGFRGIKVRKISDAVEFSDFLIHQKVPYLLQEFCSYKEEYGIFYYRHPAADTGSIPSITLKEFLSVSGTGCHTLEELVKANPRAILQASRLRDKFNANWQQVLPQGQRLELEGIGNHNLGTRFRDGSHLADDRLLDIFDTLSRQMEGFYFGRFDIRADSWEDLRNQERFKILEVNGIGAEPTHMYDPENSLLQAWEALCRTWRMSAEIARENLKRGTPRPTFKKARILWEAYKAYRPAVEEGSRQSHSQNKAYSCPRTDKSGSQRPDAI